MYTVYLCEYKNQYSSMKVLRAVPCVFHRGCFVVREKEPWMMTAKKLGVCENFRRVVDLYRIPGIVCGKWILPRNLK